MALVIPELENVPPVTMPGHKPRHVFHGRRMQQMKKVKTAIQALYRQDTAESKRAETENRTPFLVTGVTGSDTTAAFQDVLDRVSALIDLKQ